MLWLLVLLLALAVAAPAGAQPLQGSSLTITDTTGAFIRAPRLTQTQRDNSSHNPGEMIYCTDCASLGLMFWNGAQWVSMIGGGSPGPGGGVGGAGATDQVAVWSSGSTITGSAGLTYTSSVLSAPNLRVPGPNALVVVNPNPGYWPPGGFTSIFANVDTNHPNDAEAAAVLFTHNTTGAGIWSPRYGAVISASADLPTSSQSMYGARISTSIKTGAPVDATGYSLEIINMNEVTADKTIGVLVSNNGPLRGYAAHVVSQNSNYLYGIQFQPGAVSGHAIDIAGTPARAISIGTSSGFGIYQTTSSVLNRLEGGVIMGPVAALPAFGNQGRLMVRTTDNTLHLDTGAAWSQIGGAVSGGHAIQDEASAALTNRPTLAFVGTGVQATDDAGGNRTVVTIPGSAGATGSAIYRWQNTVGGAAASGDVQYDNANPALVTAIHISETDNLGQDVSNFLGSLVAGDGLYIQDQGDATKWARYTVTGAPTDAGTYRTIPVSFAGAGTAIADNQLSLVRIQAGNLQNVTGGGTAPRLAYWQSATAIASVPGLEWSGTILSAPNIALTATPAMTIAPTANASISTLNSLNVQGSTNSTSRVFAGHFGLTTTGGVSGDKVALYAGLRHQGGYDAWAFNTVLTQEAGSGSYNAQGYELDFNNLNAHRGDTDGAGGLGPPVSYGLSITGASSFRSTAAMLIGGVNPGMWNRGILIANNSISATGSSFQDTAANHHKSIDIRGNPVYGIYQVNAGSQNLLAGGAILGPVASLPATGNAGRLLFRTADNTLYADTGAAWIPVSGSGSSNLAVFNVKLYGAAGNDSANDTTAIQNAANALCAASPPGGVLYFPPGRYRTNSHIGINCGMIVQGDGWGDKASLGGSSIISTSATQDHLQVNAPNQVIIRAIALRSIVAKTAGAAIRFMGYNENTSCFTQNPGARIEHVLMGGDYLDANQKVWDGVTNLGGGVCTAHMDKSAIAFINRGVDMSQGEGGIDVHNSYIVGLDVTRSIAAVNVSGFNNFFHSQGPATLLLDQKPPVLAVSLTRSGSTVTGTVTIPHGFVVGSVIRVQGAGSNYNGLQTVTGKTAFTFTYTMAGTTTPGSGTVRFDSILAEGGQFHNNIVEGGQTTVGLSIQMQNTLANTSRITGNSFYGARSGIQVAQVAGLTPVVPSNWTAFTITGNVFQLYGGTDGSCIDMDNAQDGVISGNACNFGSSTGNTAGLVIRASTSYIDVGVNQTGINVDTPYTFTSGVPTSVRSPVYQTASGTVFINTPLTIGNDQLRIHSAASTPSGANIVLQGNTDNNGTAGKAIRARDGMLEVMSSGYNDYLLRLIEPSVLVSGETTLEIKRQGTVLLQTHRVKVGPANSCPNSAGTPNSARCLYIDN